MNDSPPPSKFKTLIVMGAPGSGKGTQGSIIGQIPRFYHFSTGDAFRRLDTRTEIGQQFVKYSAEGRLVPDEIVVKFCVAQLDNAVDAHAFKADVDFLVLDGIPRNTRQAELMDEHIDVLQLFHLSCPNREELIRRLRKRALKEQRMDDANEEVIRRRFETYERETKELLEHYPSEIVTDIDANQPPVKVLSDMLQAIIQLPDWQEFSKQVV